MAKRQISCVAAGEGASVHIGWSQGVEIRAVVIDMIEQVAAEQSRPIKKLEDSLSLIDSGLNSLCLAVIVAKLEEELGVDPFSTDVVVQFPKTIGDLIICYEHALI